MYQNWYPDRGGKTSPNPLKINFCLQGVPLGSPGFPLTPVTKIESGRRGASQKNLAPLGDPKSTKIRSKIYDPTNALKITKVSPKGPQKYPI